LHCSTYTNSSIVLQDDVEDIKTVTSYFESKGYQIYAIIGHSRGMRITLIVPSLAQNLNGVLEGSVASFRYASTCRVPVPHLVNVAGRYRMNLIRGRQTKEQTQDLKEKVITIEN
jgi:hypothetical protein